MLTGLLNPHTFKWNETIWHPAGGFCLGEGIVRDLSHVYENNKVLNKLCFAVCFALSVRLSFIADVVTIDDFRSVFE